MKYIILLICVCSISANANCQIISESLRSVREKYRPLFGNETASLAIDFVRQYELGQTDYKYYLIIKVNNESIEKEAISFGYSLFGSGLLSGSSASGNVKYAVEKVNGEVILNRDELLTLYECGNNVYKHINDIKNERETPETLAFCEVNGITMGAELYNTSINGASVKFYFKVKNEAVFEMAQSEFEQVMTNISWMKRNWPE